jgi:4-amino-4-deoxy-L-arabinose transferase-like glycosyltransferase
MATDVALLGRNRSRAGALLGRLSSWWSEVLFPGGPLPQQSRRAVLICEGILVLAAALLSFARPDCPLQEPEETLYAEVPRQMMAEGRLLVPVRHGEAYYDKPPLLYWLVIASYRLCGVHDWAARLVPSGAAFLCVLVTYAWGKRTSGPRAAFAGALMLCLSPRFAQLARMLTTNGLLSLCVIAALAAAHRALAGPAVKRRWWLLSALACGLGLLAKGPVAAVLVAVPVLLYQLLDRRSARTGVRLWMAYGAVAGLVAVPWFVAVSVRDPSFLHYFFWTHHVRRFVDPFNHVQPWWYYLPLLAAGMMPWTLLAPWFLRHLLGRTRPLPQRAEALGVFLLAGLWSVAFFSASGCKRPCYILPAMPPLALALGCCVDAAFAAGRLRPLHWACAAAATFLVLFGAAQFLLPAYAGKYSLRDQIVPHAEAGSGPLPVMTYPHGWDGVSYYLQRGDVRVFRLTQLGDMVSALARQPESLVVVKSDASLDCFREALPASLQFVPCSSRPPVVVGWVRRR